MRLFTSSEKRVTGMHQTVFSILRITRKGMPFDISDIYAKKYLLNSKAPKLSQVENEFLTFFLRDSRNFQWAKRKHIDFVNLY